MGLLDKLKNALFEEEYVEVDEKPKKVKKEKPKKEEVEKKEKPVAKKVILPRKKSVKVEELHEEELIDEDFEIRPKDDIIKETEEENTRELENTIEKEATMPRMTREEFKMMNDEDFVVEPSISYDEPEIVQVIDNSDSNFLDDNTNNDSSNNYYQGSDNESKHLYGMNEPEIRVQDYGSYEKKEEKGYFRPSPIISPIYGILDRNYRKEDVVSKKDVRVASSYSRKRVNIDDVRDKAYGGINSVNEVKETVESDFDNSSFEVEEIDEDKRLVDLSDYDAKPTVKEVTVGDAVEYFHDLGLEYNVDYVDASKDVTKKRRSRVEENAKVAEEIEQEEQEKEVVVEEPKQPEEIKEEIKPVVKKEKKVVAVAKVESVEPVNEKEKDPLLDTSDNLFDLIDSMYQENE